jgi:hypothetical protein
MPQRRPSVLDAIKKPERPVNQSPADAERTIPLNQQGIFEGGMHIGDDPNSIDNVMKKYGGVMMPAAGILEGEGIQGSPIIKSLGKRLDELLDAVFTTPKGSGLPSRLKLTNWDARTGNIDFHAFGKSAERFQATPQQLDTLLQRGGMDLEQPATKAVGTIQKKLQSALPK